MILKTLKGRFLSEKPTPTCTALQRRSNLFKVFIFSRNDATNLFSLMGVVFVAEC